MKTVIFMSNKQQSGEGKKSPGGIDEQKESEAMQRERERERERETDKRHKQSH